MVKTEYGKAIASLIAKEKKSNIKQKLEDKKVTVGKGWNVSNLNKEYRKEKFKENVRSSADRLEKSLKKNLQKKVTARKILKDGKMVVRISEHKPAPYINRYFKGEMKEDAKGMFF